MGSGPVYKGKSTHGDKPDWRPLMDAIGGYFMWMFEVKLTDGTLLQAYKHIDTRRYLHLDAEGRAFVFEAPNRYRSVPLEDAIEAVFERSRAGR